MPYRIRITDPLIVNVAIPVKYVRRRRDWDYSPYTRHAYDARIYKTQRNAQRWLNERPEIKGLVEEVP